MHVRPLSPGPSGRPRTALPLIGQFHTARLSPPTRQGLLRGLLVYRWLTFGWVALVYGWEVYQRNVRNVGEDMVARPAAGFVLVGLVLAMNVALTVLYRRDPDSLLTPPPVLIELFLAAGLLLADVWVYGFADHAQALPSVWVVAGVFAAAIAAGQRPAVIAGCGLGLARYVGWLPFATESDGYYSLARVASWVLLGVAGWTAGYVLKKLEAADRSISAFRAREEVARTLHDGVLQTLAIIQRRSDDQELVELARNQELELREYLFGASPPATDLASGLRAAARRAEQRHGLRVDVVTAPDLPTGDDRTIHAICGAVGEALTNASKHGGADKATVYAEPADDVGPGARLRETLTGGSEPSPTVFVSVKDDGSGFDDTQFDHAVLDHAGSDGAGSDGGQGLSRSIRGRVVELGGRVEIDGRPGRGAEIRMWV